MQSIEKEERMSSRAGTLQYNSPIGNNQILIVDVDSQRRPTEDAAYPVQLNTFPATAKSNPLVNQHNSVIIDLNEEFGASHRDQKDEVIRRIKSVKQ